MDRIQQDEIRLFLQSDIILLDEAPDRVSKTQELQSVGKRLLQKVFPLKPLGAALLL